MRTLRKWMGPFGSGDDLYMEAKGLDHEFETVDSGEFYLVSDIEPLLAACAAWLDLPIHSNIDALKSAIRTAQGVTDPPPGRRAQSR